jgi:hypothetical protein
MYGPPEPLGKFGKHNVKPYEIKRVVEKPDACGVLMQ